MANMKLTGKLPLPAVGASSTNYGTSGVSKYKANHSLTVLQVDRNQVGAGKANKSKV